MKTIPANHIILSSAPSLVDMVSKIILTSTRTSGGYGKQNHINFNSNYGAA
jgi:hypothetical protein